MDVVGHIGAHVAECDTTSRTGDASDNLAVLENFRVPLGNRVALDLEHPQAAVHLAAVVLARNRLLARIAPLGEADVRLVETGFGREDAVVDLPTPAGDARLDAPALECLFIDLRASGPLVEHLAATEDEPCFVLFGLDVDLRGEAQP